MSKDHETRSRRAHVQAVKGQGTPKKYDNDPHTCAHGKSLFEIEGKIDPIKGRYGEDAEPEIIGHVLVIYRVQCKECGVRFKFDKLPIAGDPRMMAISPGASGGLVMHTPVVPDLLIAVPKPKKIITAI